jgi:hypothetical protein
MQRSGTAGLFSVVILAATAAAGPTLADCKGEVEAAFQKQRTLKSFRMTVKAPKDDGTVVEQVTDYVLPDKMHQSIIAPDEEKPLETIAISKWAWSNQPGYWEELKPYFAQLIAEDIRSRLVDPLKLAAEFECLGKVTLEGKEYLGYRTEPEAFKEGPPVARTIYVEEASGLPAFNIVAAVAPDAKPVFKAEFSYPTDIVIEAPLAMPTEAK